MEDSDEAAKVELSIIKAKAAYEKLRQRAVVLKVAKDQGWPVAKELSILQDQGEDPLIKKAMKNAAKRTSYVAKRGKTDRRGGPYRRPNDTQRDMAYGQARPDLQPTQLWQAPRRETQPFPPGETRMPPKFGSQDQKIRCYSCLKFGHKSPVCPDKLS